MKIQIIGAGSAGMHFLKAAQRLKEELSRVEIRVVAPDVAELPGRYLNRYGAVLEDVETGTEIEGCDYAVIATPPDTHLDLIAPLSDAKGIVIEKPLCSPKEEGKLRSFLMSGFEPRVYVNYQYLLHPALQWLRENIPKVSEPVIAHVLWQEHLSFMGQAHPWADESWYITDSLRGGGAANEHSHGLALLINGVLASMGNHPLSSNSIKVFENGHDSYSNFVLSVLNEGHYLGGGTATMDFMSYKPVKKLTLCCPQVTAEVDFYSQRATIHRPDLLLAEEFSVSREDEFLLTLRHILNTSGYADSPIALHNVVPIQEILFGHYREIINDGGLH